MKRLVYSPSVNVYVKSDFGVIDLSEYVTGCSVTRKVNQASSATVTFRNPKIETNGRTRFMFTEHEKNGKVGPVFHPMDPIIITMTRLRGKPIQVFTGYCDTTPYVQLYPGLAKIEATCTLKRLHHTYWDPGLEYVQQFMSKYGWEYNIATGQSLMLNSKAVDSKQLNDTGVGNLLMAMLNEIGGWQKEDLILQPLPSNAIQKSVGKIFDDLVKSGKDAVKQYNDYLNEFVTAAAIVGGGDVAAGGGGSETFPPGEGKIVAATFYGQTAADAGGAFAGGGTKTPDGVIPSSNPPPHRGVNNGYWFAELSNNHTAAVSNMDFAAMGNLKHGTPVQVTYKNKSIIVRKADVGGGGPGLSGHPRVIDLWYDAAKDLGFLSAGLGLVKVKVLTEDMVKKIRRGEAI